MAKKRTTRKPSPEEQETRAKRRAVAVKFVGLALGVVVVMALISSISYIFHWTEDAALVGDIRNGANKTGSFLGGLLMRDSFGLASFVLIVLMAFASRSLFLRERPEKMFAKTGLALGATVWLSTFLAYVSTLFSADCFFGGGLGGRMGSAINAQMLSLFGRVVSFCILALVLLVILVLSSRRVMDWFSTAFEKKPRNEGEKAPETVGEEVESDAVTESGTAAEGEYREEDEDPEALEKELDEWEKELDEELEEEAVPAEEAPAEDAPAPAPVTIIEGEGFNVNVTEDLPPFDIKEGMENYEAPSLDLLKDYASDVHKVPASIIDMNSARIQNTLQSYRIMVDRVEAIPGPTVTLYKVFLAEGMKSASVKNVEDDIAMALNVKSVRVVRLLDSMGIEVPNDERSIVPLKSMLDSPAFRKSKAELPVALGYTITQDVIVFDLADAPHLLVAGATKQGKSVCLNVIVSSLLYSKHPSELKFVFVDPKKVEFSTYRKLLHHYLATIPGAANAEEEAERIIVNDQSLADATLRSLCIEMDNRYTLFSKAGVNQIKAYNEKYRHRHLLPTEGHHFLPYLVVIIDEYADLIMSVDGPEAKARSRSIAASIVRLAQKGRACGINVIIATQRPSADVITGLIRSNFPVKIAFKVSTRVNSSVILDSTGAEKLTGKGDGLFSTGVSMDRFQCAMIDIDEVERVTSAIGNQTGLHAHYSTPYYLPEPPSSDEDSSGAGGMIDMSRIDDNFEEAARLVVSIQKASVSDLQRKLGMGFARAGKVMDQLEAAGIVGPSLGSRSREVLVKDFAELSPILDAFLKQ